MITIDGSQGEGGGQIIRSALALSAITGKPFEIVNVRGKRKNPGLLRQHLTAVGAAREICGAGITGAELGSSEITFAPGPVQTRDFHFDVGSAGSATLVAQTVLPALMTADRPSSITIAGGTHNDMAPPFDFLQRAYLPMVARMGPQFLATIETYGFYPRGGGKISIEVTPSQILKPLEVIERGGPIVPTVVALVSQLSTDIGHREVDLIRRKASWNVNRCQVRAVNSPGPGNVVMIELACPNVTELFTGFGKRGVSAEDIAKRVYKAAKEHLESEVPVGEYLADQLLLPLGIAASQGKSSRFRTGLLSLHSQTHIDILKLFLEIKVIITEITSATFQVDLCAGN